MLTSVQKAAFNAAGEAIADLNIKITLGRSLGKFYAFGENPIHSSRATIFGDHMGTMAEAVQNFLDKREEIANQPVKLATAAEAITAVKGILKTEYYGNEEALLDLIDALPVA